MMEGFYELLGKKILNNILNNILNKILLNHDYVSFDSPGWLTARGHSRLGQFQNFENTREINP
jgi:hypothetical protein